MPTPTLDNYTGGNTVQRALFGNDVIDPVRDPVTCVGGCGRKLAPKDLRSTPEGFMCEKCIADLYVACADCSKMLRFNDWGECDDLRVGPDNVRRCVSCDRAKFSTCAHCGRRTVREGGDVRTHPDIPEDEFCVPCWNGLWFVCAECDDVFSRHDAFNSPDGSDRYCEGCFEQHYFRCGRCANSFEISDIRGWAGDPFCADCYGNADVWKPQPWSGVATTFDRVGSKRCYGVELETQTCDEYRLLHGDTEWGCVYECSTPGREFVSPILQGDEGFAEIRAICDIAERYRWSVDRSCGLHVHVDARDLSSDQLLQVIYAYRKSYPLWKRFVSRRRGDNSMCGSPQYVPRDVRGAEHVEDFIESRDRFEFVNWRSYLRYGSIEIRLYRGTLQAREICNWVALHTRFVDAVKDMTFDEIDDGIGAITRTNWRGLVELIGDPNLLDYWRRIASRHGHALPALWDNEPDSMAPSESDDSEEYDETEQDSRQFSPRGPCEDSGCREW